MDFSTIDKKMLSEFTIFADYPELRAVTVAGKAFESNSTRYNDPGNGKNDVLSKPELRFYNNIDLPAECLAKIRQVHGNSVKVVFEPGSFGESDGMITRKKNTYLRIVTADCLPLFFYDPVSRSIGLAHAGWRGLKANIAGKVTRQMQSSFKTKPMDLLVAVGPFIRDCCYSVKDDVASLFSAGFAKPAKNGKYMVNLGEIVMNQLTDSGIRRKNVEISKECTYCHKERFSSARRDGKRSGRNISLIGLVHNN